MIRLPGGPPSEEEFRVELAALGLEFATWTPEQLRNAAMQARHRAVRLRAELDRPGASEDDTPDARRERAARYDRAADLCDLAASQLEVP
ncbi:MAG TPA: hypothetical protein VHB21_21870 [Minicystis sp.]|nr:hypothetical protein [Minicystis sp.]